jgi:hypothetical protein
MVSVCLEDLADVPVRESRAELVRFEEIGLELRWCVKLVALLTVTLAAQACGVVGREPRPAVRAAVVTATCAACLAAGSAHRDPPPTS